MTDEPAKPTKNTERTIGIITIVGFVLLLAMGVWFYQASNTAIEREYFTYNSIPFSPADSGVGFIFEFYLNDAQFPTLMSIREDPRTLEDIPIDPSYVKEIILDATNVYVTIEPSDELRGATTVAAKEIDYFIDNNHLYNIPVNSSFMSPTEESQLSLEEQTIKTCEDSHDGTLVIWLRLGEETAVFEEEGCLVVQGASPNEMEIIRAADRLVLTLLGIMR